jgi:PAS domain S-box-containing protein
MAEASRQQQLLREIGELRARLEETEDTLASLARGDADALVVQGPLGSQVYTLQTPEQPYRVIVERMQEGAITLSSTGDILYCNLSFVDLLKAPLGKVTGQPLRPFVCEHDRPLFDSLLSEGRKDATKGELSLVALDGAHIPVILSVTPLSLVGPGGVCIVVTDLTDQKRNAEIVASEKLARAILAHSAEAMVVCDDRGRIIRSCQAAERLCGRDPLLEHFDAVFPLQFRSGQTVLRPYGDTNREMDGPGYPLSRALRGETLVGIEAEFVRAGGKTCDLLVTAGAVRGENNEVLGCVVTLVDITDRKKAEEALRDGERRFRRLFESSMAPMGCWRVDGSITDANDALLRLIGYSGQEVRSGLVGWEDLTPVEYRATYERALHQCISTGVCLPYENEYIRKDGARVPVLIGGALMTDGVSPEGVFFAIDLTVHKSVETERELHIEQIRSLNSRLQRAMAETHHRVKNNLQVIAALIDLQILNGDEMVSSRELQRLSQHVRTLASVHDLLTQESKDEGDISTVSAEATIERLIPLIQSMAGPSRRVGFNVTDARLPVKLGTSMAVLINELVSNAVKHGDGDIELSFAVTGRTARLSVSDQGIGFPSNFDPIRQANTGVELIESLSRWDLQGETSYENRPEGGARVVVTFPLP